MLKKATFWVMYAFFALCIRSAHADQSQCTDVLLDGTKSQKLYRERVAYRQLVDSQFASIGFEESKKNKSISGNIPIGEIVIGGSYDESQYKYKRERIQHSQTWDTRYARDIDILLASGDPDILRAWTSCMRDRAGGLSIRFEQVTGKSAVAVVEWFGAAAITQTSLTGNWTPPTGVSIVSGSECVSREFAGRRQYLVANKPGGCVVELKFESARIPLRKVCTSGPHIASV